MEHLVITIDKNHFMEEMQLGHVPTYPISLSPFPPCAPLNFCLKTSPLVAFHIYFYHLYQWLVTIK